MDYTSILEQHQALVNAVEQSMAQQAAEQARKQAEFQSLKNSVDKVFFAYTLQRASDEKLTEWTQYLSSGVSVDLVASIMRSDNSSMYFGAGREASINNAFTTLFGRSPTAGEAARYSSVDTALIPGLVALEATGSDAETMYLRLHGAQAIKDYYQATNIPLTYGMPAMKAKEQLLTLKAGVDAQDLVSDAVREMGDFLAEWGRVIKKPEGAQTDIEPPDKRYFYTDADTVGVAFYEPPSAAGFGRVLFSFNEPVDWSALDKNRDGRLELFTELDLILSNPRLFGDNPTIKAEVGVNSVVINIGANASSPLFSGSNAAGELVLGDFVTFVGVSDYQGNSGAVLFSLTGNPASSSITDSSAPLAVTEPAGKARVVGEAVILRFNEIIDWDAMDKDGNGVLSLGYIGSGAELIISTSEVNMLGASPTVVSYYDNQLTLKMSAGHTYSEVTSAPGVTPITYDTNDDIVVIGVRDLTGNVINATFAAPYST
ncbi:hypothetical protein [Azonexus sp.]|uniref:hypothetical protein n=1 Tax=Azonexus sp. TaxID=1872668 RepID=UPI0027BA9A59|nr:hypothetical protein [Azonexus sp.]